MGCHALWRRELYGLTLSDEYHHRHHPARSDRAGTSCLPQAAATGHHPASHKELLLGGLLRDRQIGQLLDEARIGAARADLLERGQISVELLSVATIAPTRQS